MMDNQLIKLFLPIITAGLTADGFTQVTVQQMDQPTQQGIPSGPTVYFQKINDHRYGWGGRHAKWDPLSSTMKNYEIQWHETTFQVSALVVPVPVMGVTFLESEDGLQLISETGDTLISETVPDPYTAADLANEVASILQSEQAQVTLMAQNVGILRVQNLNNPYFQDDRDQFEATPSFDFILTHLETRISIVPIASPFVVNIVRE